MYKNHRTSGFEINEGKTKFMGILKKEQLKLQNYNFDGYLETTIGKEKIQEMIVRGVWQREHH